MSQICRSVQDAAYQRAVSVMAVLWKDRRRKGERKRDLAVAIPMVHRLGNGEEEVVDCKK